MKTSIILPEQWNEIEITSGINRYSGDHNRLMFYAQEVVARFVDGQQTKTAEYRLEFLKKQSELLRAGLENYKLRREITRAVHHEDAADIKAKSAVASAQREAGLDELRHSAEREKLLTDIEEQHKKRAEMNKPAPVPPPESKREDPAEFGKRRQKEIPEELAAIDKRIQAIRDDPAKKEADKRREINMYEDKKQRLYEELSKYV